MSWSWVKPGPLSLVGGSEPLLVSRQLILARAACRATGRVFTEARSLDELDCLLLDGSLALVIVRDLSWWPVGEAKAHVKAGGPVSVVGLVEGELDKAKPPGWGSEVPPASRMAFNRPGTRREQEAFALRFLLAEAKDLGLEWASEDLASQVALRVGTDPGVLAFECLKYQMAAEAAGTKTLTSALVGPLLYEAAEADWRPLVASIGARDVKALLRHAYRAQGALKGSQDPLMLLLRGRGLVGDSAVAWLQASLLRDGGLSDPEALAGALGQPRWLVEREILPVLALWSTGELRALVGALARVEEATVSGAPSPWVGLLSGVARILSPPVSCPPGL